MKPEVILYTMGHCPFCHRAKADLRAKGVTAWTEIDVEADPSHRSAMRIASGGRNTVPQIFINGTHVGGSDDLRALDASGGLDQLLNEAILV
ncbi:glutaredoxin 3 [Sphingopyxis sp. EG6]|jgi:glutaredoxin 3|uniref:glutaredoxin 3 n=1 Tax=Sphingopyxis sp. EG6 TaxID=1874061 RepID=UPI000DC61C59|nr:glutaredoxin 3 [Sphingopyxis sp. EG6]BBB08692.1 glutaredoxin GrxC [Sphingopyxis sp. EG6]